MLLALIILSLGLRNIKGYKEKKALKREVLSEPAGLRNIKSLNVSPLLHLALYRNKNLAYNHNYLEIACRDPELVMPKGIARDMAWRLKE
jgi:hypothetical protein